MAYRRSYTRRRYVPRALRTRGRPSTRYRAALNRRHFPRYSRSSLSRYSRGRIGNPLRRGNVAQANKAQPDLTSSQKFMFAQLDPFDTKSSGAKIPDSNMMPSITNTDTDVITFSSTATASNINAIAFRPAYASAVITGTAGATVGWGANFTANVATRGKAIQYAGQIELTRPVAHAIRVTSPVAPTAATGFIHLGISTESFRNKTTWELPTTVAAMANLQFYRRVTLASLTQTPLTMINKWIDDTAFRYSDPGTQAGSASDNEFQTDLSWGILVVMYEGVPVSSNVLSIEHLLLSEGIPQRDGVFIGSQAAPNSPGVLAATSSAISSIEPFHNEAQQESHVAQGLNALREGAMNAGTQVFNNVALPLLQRFGYATAGTALTMGMQAMTGVGGISGVNSNPARLTI